MARILLTLGAMAGAALAKDDIYVSGDLHLNAGVEFGVGGVAIDSANFGLGRFDTTGAVTGETSPFYIDGYAEPYMEIKYSRGGTVEFFSRVSVVLAGTRGDGDPAGFTDGSEEDVDLELAYGGLNWQISPDRKIEVIGGAQNIQIGDGFLFWDGDFDTLGDSNYWAAPRSAFDWAVLTRLANGSLALTGFLAEADKDNGNARFVGGDAQWESSIGTFGATAAHFFDDDAGFGREGLNLVSLRALNAALLPTAPRLKFSSEITHEFGDGPARDFDAWGGYGQVAYEFDLPWSPVLSYRFSYFSGGSVADPTESFDPLFYGTPVWGTWTQGEIVGEYLLFNSNQIAHQVKLAVTPIEDVGAGLMYFHFDLDKKNYFGTPVTSARFADEVNLYVDWQVNENLYLGAVAGLAIPAKAAKQAFGDDDITGLFEVLAIFTY